MVAPIASSITNTQADPTTTPSNPAPFIQRLINVTFTLATGVFQNTTSNSVTLSGLRVSARIANAGGYNLSTLDLDIYGMPLSLMNQLSLLGIRVQFLPINRITVEAGDASTGMGIVYFGDIFDARFDGSTAPDVPFRVQAQVAAGSAVLNYPPQSFTGSADVAAILSGLATVMGWRFENNGVSVKIPRPYLYGSPVDQMKKVIEAANIQSNMGAEGVLAIWPKNGNRSGAVPIIQAGGNMIGYPTFHSAGIEVHAVYSPSIGLGPPGAVGTSPGGGVQLGGLIQIQGSILPQANKTWKVYSLDHVLESLVPNGQWFSVINAIDPNNPSPVV